MEKYINEQGLSKIISLLNSFCLTQEDGAAISEALSTLADAITYPKFTITIPTTGWQSGEAGQFKYYKDVASSNITSDDAVNVYLDHESLTYADECQLSSTVDTLNGYIRFWSVSIPTNAMTGEYRILRGQ